MRRLDLTYPQHKVLCYLAAVGEPRVVGTVAAATSLEVIVAQAALKDLYRLGLVVERKRGDNPQPLYSTELKTVPWDEVHSS